MSKITARLAVAICLSLCLTSSAMAQSLLDSSVDQAEKHDLVKHFGFALKTTQQAPGKNDITTKLYYSDKWSSLLALDVDKSGHIVHMRLGVPRLLLDSQQYTISGRDLVKSFLESAALSPTDAANLKQVGLEISVRDLDLQPVDMSKAGTTFADSGNPIPTAQAYKIGKGPSKPGDQLVFFAQLPKLAEKPSDIYETMMGKEERTGKIFHDCRIALANQELAQNNKESVKQSLLWCDAFDEKYWQVLNPEPTKHP